MKQNALELARRGDLSAIAVLVNKSLNPKGINAKINRKDSYLQVLLESEQPMNQQALTRFIVKGFAGLKIEAVQSIAIYARRKGRIEPDWTQRIDLKPKAETLQAVLQPSSSLTSNQKALKPNSSSINEPQVLKLKKIAWNQVSPVRLGIAISGVLAVSLVLFLPHWFKRSQENAAWEKLDKISSGLSEPTRAISPGITKAKYDQISAGMSYDQVREVLGESGEEMSRSEIANISTVMYIWKNPGGSNMNAMFQNDSLVQKAQFGLD